MNKIIRNIKLNQREMIFTSLAQIIYILESVLQNKIFTSFFSTDIYGKWALLLSIYTLISMLPFTAFDQGVNRVASDCRNNNQERTLYNLISLVYGIGFLLYTIILGIIYLIQKEDFFASGCYIVFMVYTSTEIIKNTFILIDNAYRNRIRVFNIRLFELVSRCILLFVLYKVNAFAIFNVLLVLGLTNVGIIIYQQLYFHMFSRIIVDDNVRNLCRKILKFSLPLMTWAVFGWMQNMISRWYLDAFLDLNAVAMYSVLTSLSYFVPSAIYTIFNAYITPIVFEKNASFTRSKLFKYMGAVGVLELCYVTIVVVFGKYIILILTSSAYLQILDYLPFTTISACLYVLSMLSTIEIFRRNETKKLLMSTIAPGLLMATVGFFLVKILGFNGAVINYIMGQLTYIVFTSIVVFNKKNLSQER